MRFHIEDYGSGRRKVYNFRGDEKVKQFTVEELVFEAIEPDPYSSEGALETIEERVLNLAKLVASLMKDTLSAPEVVKHLTPFFHVKEITPVEED